MADLKNRTNPDEHRRQVRLANAAKAEATKRLIEMHNDDFDVLAREEYAKRGVEYMGTQRAQRRRKMAKLKEELEALEAQERADNEADAQYAVDEAAMKIGPDGTVYHGRPPSMSLVQWAGLETVEREGAVSGK